MALNNLKHGFLMIIVASLAMARKAKAGDPDIISDFVNPSNGNKADGGYFTYTGLRHLATQLPPSIFTVSKASVQEFPALNGQSVSYAVLQFPDGAINPPHIHPRSAELLYLISGSLEVGFVDTKNKLYTNTLEAGDMFLFPKGLVHYQRNIDTSFETVAFSAFGSANAGTVSIPGTVFNKGIDDGILAKSFKTDVATVKKIKAGLAS